MAHAPTHIGLERPAGLLGPRAAGVETAPEQPWSLPAKFPQVFAAAAAAAIDAIAIGCGGLVAVRRLSSAWEPPATPAALVAVCVAGGLLVTAADLTRRAAGRRPGLASRLAVAVAAAALAIPLPMKNPPHLLLAIAALIATAATVAWPLRSARPRRRAAAFVPRAMTAPTAKPESPPAEVSREPPGQVLQQFTRFVRSDGVECVCGRLSLTVPAGVRVAAGHIGFCPPFPKTPTVDVTTDYDGVEAVVAASEVLPWGVRIECRLDEPADDAFEIPIDISAEAPATGSSA